MTASTLLFRNLWESNKKEQESTDTRIAVICDVDISNWVNGGDGTS